MPWSPVPIPTCGNETNNMATNMTTNVTNNVLYVAFTCLTREL